MIAVADGKGETGKTTVPTNLVVVATGTGRRWIRSRRPELYAPLTVPTGHERDTRALRFNKPDA